MLYVGMLKGKYDEVRQRTVLVFLAVTLVGSLLALTLSHYLSQRLSGSVKLLVAGAEQLACGNLDQRVELRSGDEFQELAETFNAMAEALKARDEQLKDQAARKVMESERLALVGQLAAGVAHEINNPLTGIVTYSQLLLEKAPGEGSTRSSLQKIVTQAERCRKIVRGLLDFSRQTQARRAAVQREHGPAGVPCAGRRPGRCSRTSRWRGTWRRTCRWCRWTRRRSSRCS